MTYDDSPAHLHTLFFLCKLNEYPDYNSIKFNYSLNKFFEKKIVGKSFNFDEDFEETEFRELLLQGDNRATISSHFPAISPEKWRRRILSPRISRQKRGRIVALKMEYNATIESPSARRPTGGGGGGGLLSE